MKSSFPEHAARCGPWVYEEAPTSGFSGLHAAQKRTEVIAEYQNRRQPQNSSVEHLTQGRRPEMSRRIVQQVLSYLRIDLDLERLVQSRRASP